MGGVLYMVLSSAIMGILALIVMYIFVSLERDLRKQEAARREKHPATRPDKERKAA